MPPLTATDKKNRALLRPTIDRLVETDDAARGVATEYLRRTAAPAVLNLLGNMLTNRAKSSTRPEAARGAMASVVQLGIVGVMRACALALSSPKAVVREAAIAALKRHGPALPPAEWMELRGALLRTRARADDPRVVAVCEDILSAIRTEDFVSDNRDGRSGEPFCETEGVPVLPPPAH
jgi:predicted component of type VI protein secretion system